MCSIDDDTSSHTHNLNTVIKSKDVQIATLEREVKSIRDSKEEVIKSKYAQIELLKNNSYVLRQLSSDKILELHLSVKGKLEALLSEVHEEIKQLEDTGNSNKTEKNRLEYKVPLLENELQGFRDTTTASPAQTGNVSPEVLVMLANILKKPTPPHHAFPRHREEQHVGTKIIRSR